MPPVRLTTDRNDRGFEQRAGDVIDVPPAEAKRLLDSRQAELVRDEPPVQTAALRAKPPRKRG